MIRRRASVLVWLALLAPVPAAAQLGYQSGFPCATVDTWEPPAQVRVARTGNGLNLSWLPPPGAPFEIDGFQISRAPELAGPYGPLAVVQGTVNEYLDASAAPNQAYWYRIRSFEDRLCSRPSQAVRGLR
jgi:hypothetical protein